MRTISFAYTSFVVTATFFGFMQRRNFIETEQINFKLVPGLDNYAVMGNPISHSKSPQIHKAFASQVGQKLHYQSILVPFSMFEQAARLFLERGGKGLNITIPYKQDAFYFATRLTSRARFAKAVNTLSFNSSSVIDGDNTDGIGLLRDLERNRIDITGKRLLLVGAGGAVCGIFKTLLEQNLDSITVANRTLTRAKTLVSQYNNASNILACSLSDLRKMGEFDVIINGTSASLTMELPELPESIINKKSSCYDMAYGDSESVFVKWSKSLGAKIAVDGLGMLIEQAAESFYIWRGVRPDTGPVIKRLRAEMR